MFISNKIFPRKIFCRNFPRNFLKEKFLQLLLTVNYIDKMGIHGKLKFLKTYHNNLSCLSRYVFFAFFSPSSPICALHRYHTVFFPHSHPNPLSSSPPPLLPLSFPSSPLFTTPAPSPPPQVPLSLLHSMSFDFLYVLITKSPMLNHFAAPSDVVLVNSKEEFKNILTKVQGICSLYFYDF